MNADHPKMGVNFACRSTASIPLAKDLMSDAGFLLDQVYDYEADANDGRLLRGLKNWPPNTPWEENANLKEAVQSLLGEISDEHENEP